MVPGQAAASRPADRVARPVAGRGNGSMEVVDARDDGRVTHVAHPSNS
jgi:hypothetical protein